jgi:hypothetical protein
MLYLSQQVINIDQSSQTPVRVPQTRPKNFVEVRRVRVDYGLPSAFDKHLPSLLEYIRGGCC